MLFLALLLLASLIAAAALLGGKSDSGPGPDAVLRPPGVSDGAPYIDGVLTEVRTDRLKIQPSSGGDAVELTVPPEKARILDLPHLVNYHQARDEPLRIFYEEKGDVKRAIGAVDLPGGPAGSGSSGPSS